MLSRVFPLAQQQASRSALTFHVARPPRQQNPKRFHRFAIMAAASASDKLTFYDSESGCPYAHRVWLTLVEKGLSFETIKVDLNNRPADFTALYQSVSGDQHLGKVPVIIDGDNTLIESSPIVEWLDWKFPNSGTRILPEDLMDRYKAKLFVEVYTNNVSGFPLLRASTKQELQEAKDKFIAGLKVVEKFLQIHAVDEEPGYFLGSQYSFAEVATTPFVRRYAAALPALRDFDVHAVIEAEGLTRLQRWTRAVLDRPSIKETAPDDQKIVNAFKKFTVELTE